MPRNGFSEGQKGRTRSGESAEVNVSDHEYEIEHNKRNRPEIPIEIYEEGVTTNKLYLGPLTKSSSRPTLFVMLKVLVIFLAKFVCSISSCMRSSSW